MITHQIYRKANLVLKKLTPGRNVLTSVQSKYAPLNSKIKLK